MPGRKPSKGLEPEIKKALKRRFIYPEWICLNEVSVGRRRSDSFAINIYPAKRLLRYAFEIKVTRQDFLKEIKDRQKAKTFESISHRFYLVTPPDICKKNEIPKEWYWMVYYEGTQRLVTRKKGKPNKNPAFPVPLVYRLLRRLADRVYS